MDDSTERELRNIRDDVAEAVASVAKLWTSHREVQAVLWGDNVRRDDGLKSRIAGLEARVGTLESVLRDTESRMTRYLDRERAETCLGLKALAEHEAECEDLYDETRKEDTEMTIATGNNRTKLSEARLTLAGIALVAVLSLVGQIVTSTQAQATQRDVAALTHALEARK